MALPHRIGILTPELVCFHEAGHIVTAATIGAKVVRVAFLDGPPPHGVSSIERTSSQAPFIACGRYFLCQQKRLVDAAGEMADTGLFLSEAQQNAQEDVQNYLNGMTAMNVRVNDPVQDFIGTALAQVYPNIDFALVEKVAAALLERRVLDEPELAATIGSPGPNFAADIDFNA
jgi:hypothetical protein